MRLLSSLQLPLVLYLLLQTMFPTLHAVKEKAGSRIDPNGTQETTVPIGTTSPPTATGPGSNIRPTP